MGWVTMTLVVAEQDASLARSLTQGLAGDGGGGMFITGLSANGKAPATHYISTGMIQEEFVSVLAGAQETFDATGGQVPLVAIQGLYQRATIVQDDTYAVMASLGLLMIAGEPT